MKKIVLIMIVLAGLLSGNNGWAAFSNDDIKVLTQKEIALLSDDRLVDAYMDVLVEMEAGKTFHTTSGFKPREYARYKEILKYRLLLRFEIHRRKLEVPPEFN